MSSDSFVPFFFNFVFCFSFLFFRCQISKRMGETLSLFGQTKQKTCLCFLWQDAQSGSKQWDWWKWREMIGGEERKYWWKWCEKRMGKHRGYPGVSRKQKLQRSHFLYTTEERRRNQTKNTWNTSQMNDEAKWSQRVSAGFPSSHFDSTVVEFSVEPFRSVLPPLFPLSLVFVSTCLNSSTAKTMSARPKSTKGTKDAKKTSKALIEESSFAVFFWCCCFFASIFLFHFICQLLPVFKLFNAIFVVLPLLLELITPRWHHGFVYLDQQLKMKKWWNKFVRLTRLSFLFFVFILFTCLLLCLLNQIIIGDPTSVRCTLAFSQAIQLLPYKSIKSLCFWRAGIGDQGVVALVCLPVEWWLRVGWESEQCLP